MSAQLPFNLTLLELNDKVLEYIKPVRVLDTFVPSTQNFHDDGLFSTVIFGKVGDPQRSKRFSYIDIKLSILHPIIFNTITQMKTLYLDILSGKGHANWDPKLKDFVKADTLSGDTGYAFFVKHFNEIDYGQATSEKRLHALQLLRMYKSKSFTSKIVVLPAGLRDYEITDDGRESEDEFNTLYRRILALSSNIHPAMITPDSIAQLNPLRYQLQVAFNNIYEKLKSMLEGKHKLIMGKWASRSVFNGTRNVLSTTNVRVSNLNDPNSVTVNDTVIGLYQYLKATLPIAKHHLRAGFLSKVFQTSRTDIFLTDPKTLKLKSVTVPTDVYDDWMSEEGLDRLISLYGEDELRAKPLMIAGNYLGLIYKDYDKKVFKLFQDIDELPKELNKDLVSPITFTELMYISVYWDAHTYPCFNTRYPITGFGSIYPAYPYLKPTVVSAVMQPLGDDWQPDTSKPLARCFPVGKSHYNSVSCSSVHLTLMGADFDGDTVSTIVVYSKEAVDELKKLMNSRNYYVDTKGQMSFSNETDTVKYLMRRMTGDAR